MASRGRGQGEACEGEQRAGLGRQARQRSQQLPERAVGTAVQEHVTGHALRLSLDHNTQAMTSSPGSACAWMDSGRSKPPFFRMSRMRELRPHCRTV